MSKQWASLIILGLASATPALAAGQADARGFVEDSALDLFLRNAYISRDYKQGRQDKAEWGQAAMLSTLAYSPCEPYGKRVKWRSLSH